MHVQSRIDERRYAFNHNLAGDVETSERATFDEVTRIVGFAWIKREDFVVTDIYVRTKEVEEHIPRTQKQSLVKNRPDPSRKELLEES